jgi:hypothetical protein
MKTRKFFRDGLEEDIAGKITVHTTNDGHVIESYRLANGKRRFFATLSGTHWCAHGSTIAEAVADAIWKDPERRPPIEKLVEDIKAEGREHKFTLNEFRHLTGACAEGCRSALKTAGHDDTPLTAAEIREKISETWGAKLMSILDWEGHRQ